MCFAKEQRQGGGTRRDGDWPLVAGVPRPSSLSSGWGSQGWSLRNHPPPLSPRHTFAREREKGRGPPLVLPFFFNCYAAKFPIPNLLMLSLGSG